MADNNASGQDTRHSGASEILSAPSDCSATRSGPTSAKKVKRTKSTIEERSPDSFGSKPASQGPSSPTRSSKRTHFTPQQIYKLEQFFLTSQFPTAKERETLAKDLQLSTKHIQVWFQNHRAKYKRKEKKKAKTQKTTMKLQPPRSWPAQLPFDSSIASVNLDDNKREKQPGSSSTRKDSTDTTKGSSISPSSYSGVSTAASSEVSGSSNTLQSACGYSPPPGKLAAYPLSPSSPLHTPHAPLRRHSSSIAPSSPLSSTFSPPSASPKENKQKQNPSGPPTGGSTSIGGDYTCVFGSNDITGISCLDADFQSSDFSPPIFAESPVHLQNLLDDPDIGSILREHLPAPPKKISVTNSVFQSVFPAPQAPSQSSPYSFHSTQLTHIGYTGSGSSTSHPYPSNYPASSLPQPLVPIDTGLQSRATGYRLRAAVSTRQPFPAYRQPMAAGVPSVLHPSAATPTDYEPATSPQYPSVPTHPFAQAYANHQYIQQPPPTYHHSRQSLPNIGPTPQFIQSPPAVGPSHLIMPSHQSSQVPGGYSTTQTPLSVLPAAITTSSPNLFQQSSDTTPSTSR